jgi:hypothetical protein
LVTVQSAADFLSHIDEWPHAGKYHRMIFGHENAAGYPEAD